MSSVLVTGAAGFIGSHLCESLLARGYAVRGLDAFTDFYDPRLKRANLAPFLRDPRFEFVSADLACSDLTDAVLGVDAVVHLAGEPGVATSWGAAFPRYLERNVLTTQRLLEAASVLGVDRFVYASSSSVYGSDVDALRASGEPRPISPYGASKLAGESVVGAYAHQHGVPAVSLRYFSVYGPRQRPDMAMHRFIEALLDANAVTLFGDGRQSRDFTYIADVVEATVLALSADLPPAAVLDVAGAAPATVREVLGVLCELLDARDARVERLDERRGDVPHTEGRIAETRTRLGWAPATDLRTGLARQVAWHVARRAESSEPADAGPVRWEPAQQVGGQR
jgi:UDP-glucuronate 4-epimerase